MASLINKARKPKFELHLWIYDLNNVPLVAGTSIVKWHLPNSIHGEHRGRTAKCTVDKVNHRVNYNYSKTIPLRISIDKSNNLSECPIEFEVLQEFSMGSVGRDDKISLGNIRLNLSEYVEESEIFSRRTMASRAAGTVGSLEHVRDKLGKSISGNSRSASDVERTVTSPAGTTSQHPEEIDLVDEEAEEGIVRRYLMQDSKINSTLKIGILMVQADGERNYVAPPLKSATMFMGGISSILAGSIEQNAAEVEDPGGALPTIGKSRETAEAQDMYRRALAASWDCHPGELHADECIEDIFAGGNGWRDGTTQKPDSSTDSPSLGRTGSSGSASPSTTSSEDAPGGTLRPSHMRRIKAHMRGHSNVSDKSNATVTGLNDGDYGVGSLSLRPSPLPHPQGRFSRHGHGHHGHGHGHGQHGHGQPGRLSPLTPMYKDDSTNTGTGFTPFDEGPSPGLHSRSESMASLAPTLGSTQSSSEQGKLGGFRRPREIDEYELRDDLVAWKLPGTVT